jgi:hypothetical protein
VVQVNGRLEKGALAWDKSRMKLTADERGRIGNAELFRPKATFDVTVQADGSIRVVEVVQVPVVKLRRVSGRLRGADVALDRQTVAAAVRAERDAR